MTYVWCMTHNASGSPVNADSAHHATPDCVDAHEVPTWALYGKQELSYVMQPCDVRGRAINGGNHYANAHTLEGARDFAVSVLSKDTHCGYPVRSVSIHGRTLVFKGDAWSPIYGKDVPGHYEVVYSERPYLYTASDLQKQCYPSTVMDHYEIVHERRSDGTCKCGELKGWQS